MEEKLREYRDLNGQRARGLELLLKAGIAQKLPENAHFTYHPFGLVLPKECDSVWVITENSGCDLNVLATASVINRSLGALTQISKLRMITIREEENWAERRFFFEVCFPTVSYIGGSGTYYSGHGGDTTRQMRSILLTLGSIYGFGIEEEIVFADEVAKFKPEVLEQMEYQLREFLEPHRNHSREFCSQFAERWR